MENLTVRQNFICLIQGFDAEVALAAGGGAVEWKEGYY